MFWIELIIVLAIIFLGVRIGGTFLAMAGGIGMFIMTFILHVTPSDPPITVILIMIAVICAAATMQACGGLESQTVCGIQEVIQRISFVMVICCAELRNFHTFSSL